MDTPQSTSDLTVTDYDAAISILDAAASSMSIWNATAYRLHLLARLNQLVLALYLDKPSPFSGTQAKRKRPERAPPSPPRRATE